MPPLREGKQPECKRYVRLYGAHAIRGPLQRRARSHLASWLSSTQQTASIVRTERTVRWHRFTHRGGRDERVQDRDRAGTAAHVATGGGGGHIVRRVLFGAGAGADQDRLWRIAHRRARVLGQGPSDVPAAPLPQCRLTPGYISPCRRRRKDPKYGHNLSA